MIGLPPIGPGTKKAETFIPALLAAILSAVTSSTDR